MKPIEHLEVPIGYERIPMISEDDDGRRPVAIDVLLHTLLLGKSRTGKSTVMLRAILGAIYAGLGCAVIDPHGPLAESVLSHLTPEQLRRVVYIDPLAAKLPGIGYFDSGDTELTLQHFIENMKARSGRGWGPRTEEIFEGVARAVVGFFKRPTILHVYKMLNRDDFARAIISQSKDPIVQDFFQNWYGPDIKAKDRREAFSHPRNKIAELMHPGIREIVAQDGSLDWAQLMDDRKIVIVNVRKGKIGATKARTIGNLALMNMMLAAFARKHPERRFPVFVDEFHNFTDGMDVETALAEAAKCGITYFVASQTLAQLRDEERRIFNDEIALGNCSNVLSLRVSGKDALVLADEFADEHMRRGLVELPNYTVCAWIVLDNAPILKDHVSTYNAPRRSQDYVPFEKALAWVLDNSPGSDRNAVTVGILRELEKTMPPPTPPGATRHRKKRKR